ncbi:MAG TPA: DUF542 domain-containing protein [Chitinophagaceae bacterium]|nr:DUF542 domain-containing protein [Chitinophagaceae bacterium]
MSLIFNIIDDNLSVTEIVKNDYRTADVFRKYRINYCCGGKWPLKTIAELNGLNLENIKAELAEASKVVSISNTLNFQEWDMDFMLDYIINVHHKFLYSFLPDLGLLLEQFVLDHGKKFHYLGEIRANFLRLQQEILPHLAQEENVIFPYIRQIAHAYKDGESYAGLLVRTLRKPIDTIMHYEHETVESILTRMRVLTDSYALPSNYCASHKVVFGKLQELDNDLVQHLYLENSILFPKAIAMETELLKK